MFRHGGGFLVLGFTRPSGSVIETSRVFFSVDSLCYFAVFNAQTFSLKDLFVRDQSFF